MGQNCCGGTPANPTDSEIPSQTLYDKKRYTSRDIYWIVRMQAIWRGMRARMRVQRIREADYTPGYAEGDFENVNVQVS